MNRLETLSAAADSPLISAIEREKQELENFLHFFEEVVNSQQNMKLMHELLPFISKDWRCLYQLTDEQSLYQEVQKIKKTICQIFQKTCVYGPFLANQLTYINFMRENNQSHQDLPSCIISKAESHNTISNFLHYPLTNLQLSEDGMSLSNSCQDEFFTEYKAKKILILIQKALQNIISNNDKWLLSHIPWKAIKEDSYESPMNRVLECALKRSYVQSLRSLNVFLNELVGRNPLRGPNTYKSLWQNVQYFLHYSFTHNDLNHSYSLIDNLLPPGITQIEPVLRNKLAKWIYENKHSSDAIKIAQDMIHCFVFKDPSLVITANYEETEQEKKEKQIYFSSKIINLPDCFDCLSHLNSLTIRTGFIGELPVSITTLVQLSSLIIDTKYQLYQLPKGFSNLISLKRLFIRGTFITSLSPEACELPNLKRLRLYEMKNLRQLPKNIGNLLSLRNLLVERCEELKKIPSSIGSLENLKTLELSYNRIQTLPPTIKNLTKLELLDLRGNIRASKNRSSELVLPCEIADLQQLHKLLLSENQRIELPRMLGNLRQVIHLDLAHSVFDSFPKSMSSLTQLTSLTLNSCRLYKFPNFIPNIESLRFLSLKNNHISKLPDEIARLTMLETLIMSNNKLKQIPPAVGNCTSLRTLNLDNNNITEIVADFSQLSQLRELDLSKNMLSSFPHSFYENSSLRQLFLERNHFKDIQAGIIYLTSLKALGLNLDHTQQVFETGERHHRDETISLSDLKKEMNKQGCIITDRFARYRSQNQPQCTIA